jgi:hypothetical protein
VSAAAALQAANARIAAVIVILRVIIVIPLRANHRF